MNHFDLQTVAAELASGDKLYHEFLRSDSLSMGVYQLPAGSVDPQQPHAEDEVYYVASGQAKMEVGTSAVPATPGSIIFVPAHERHRFVEIESDLTVLVFFAPPES